MKNFVEYKDYQFFTFEEFNEQRKATQKRAYVILKDDDLNKFETNPDAPSTYYLVVDFTEPTTVKKCVAFAVSRHLSNVQKYSAEIQILN